MKIIFTLLFLLSVQLVTAQYKNDHVAFATVFWDELCGLLQQQPNHLLLDVRSKEEHFDTSSSKGLNIGHLKGAKNIDIREIGLRLNEIADFKNKPVFVYCSHSQRSRRASKLLADSGFTRVYNINGGVSNLRMFDWKESCNLLTTRLAYKLVSPVSFARDNPDSYYILDVRSDSAFRGISLQEKKNAVGKFKNAVNIPLQMLEGALGSVAKDRRILLVDENGIESAVAAELLQKRGYKTLFVLFNGLEAFVTEVPESERIEWVSPAAYRMMNAKTFDDMMRTKSATVIDVRSREEFNNQSKESFRNIGHIKNAVNLPYAEWDKQTPILPAGKEDLVFLYAFSSSLEVFEAAQKLSASGYKNVYVLVGGLANLRWRAANMKGHGQLKDWVVNVPPDNQ